MDTLAVTTTNRYSRADIKASVMDNGWVRIWDYYPDIKQDRHEITLTDKEWNRLVSWVQWRRSNNEAKSEP